MIRLMFLLAIIVIPFAVAAQEPELDPEKNSGLDCFFKSVTQGDGNTLALWTYAKAEDARMLLSHRFQGNACRMTNWSPKEAAQNVCDLSEKSREDTKAALLSELGVTPAAICSIAKRAAGM